MCCLFCPLKCPNAGIADSPVCLTGEYDELFGGCDESDSEDEYGPDDDDYPCDFICSDCACNTCHRK